MEKRFSFIEQQRLNLVTNIQVIEMHYAATKVYS